METSYTIASMLGFDSLRENIVSMLGEALPAVIVIGVSVWCATYGWSLFKAFAKGYIKG